MASSPFGTFNGVEPFAIFPGVGLHPIAGDQVFLGHVVYEAGTTQYIPTLVLPVGETTRFNLHSPDVIHDFGVPAFLLKMDVSKIDSVGRGQAVRQAIEIIGRRVNKFGVTEPIIQQVGDDRILVQIPGLNEEDRQEARRTIEQTAYLEFLLVHADNERLSRVH